MQNFRKYADFYNLIYKDKNYKAEAQMVYRWAGRPKLIVDLGCGTGRHHKYWKCPVIGLDQSQAMLRRAHISSHRIYIQSDIEKDIYLPNAPCYTALFNVIGYCNLEKIIAQMKQPKGGVFIFDVWDRGRVEKEGFGDKIKKFSWGKVVITPACDEFNEWELKIEVIPKKGKPILEYHSVVPYHINFIETLCRKYGYQGVRKNTKTWTTWYKLIKL